MALYNEILVGRFNRSLQKLLGIKGEPPSPQLAGEVAATHTFFSGAENRFLESWNRFQFIATGAAVAAQNSAVRFRNPSGSNVIAVIEKIIAMDITGADTLFLVTGIGDSDLTGPVGGFIVDNRGQQSAFRSTCLVSTGNNQAGGNTFGFGAHLSGSPFEFIVTDIQELSVPPNQQIDIRTNAVNVQLRASIWWRERFLEEGERQ
jgi:hypothetical protein